MVSSKLTCHDEQTPQDSFNIIAHKEFWSSYGSLYGKIQQLNVQLHFIGGICLRRKGCMLSEQCIPFIRLPKQGHKHLQYPTTAYQSVIFTRGLYWYTTVIAKSRLYGRSICWTMIPVYIIVIVGTSIMSNYV